MDAPIMAAVKPISGENGAAIVILDGRVQIVAFDWKRDATMDMTMTYCLRKGGKIILGPTPGI